MLTACLTLLSVFTACAANETSRSSAAASGTVSGMTETTAAAVETTQTTAEESTKETMKETTKETTEPAAEEGQTGEIRPEDTNDIVLDSSCVLYDGKIYVADDSGIWTQNEDETRTYLCRSKEVTKFAVNHDVCAYVKTPDDCDYRRYDNASYVPKELHVVDLDGENDRVYSNVHTAVTPLLLTGNTLYYYDYLGLSEAHTMGIFELDIDSGESKAAVEGIATPIAVGKKIYFFDKGSIYETYTTRDDVKSGTFRCFDTETGEIKSYGDKYLRCISKYVGGHYIYLISKPDRDIHANEADMYRLDVRTDQIEKSIHLSADNQVNADYYNNGKILFLELDYPGDNSTVHIVSASTGGELCRVEISDGGYGVLGKGFFAVSQNRYFYMENQLKELINIDPRKQTVLCADDNYIYYVAKNKEDAPIEKMAIASLG